MTDDEYDRLVDAVHPEELWRRRAEKAEREREGAMNAARAIGVTGDAIRTVQGLMRERDEARERAETAERFTAHLVARTEKAESARDVLVLACEMALLARDDDGLPSLPIGTIEAINAAMALAK